MKIVRLFFCSAGVFLLITAVAKLISGFGNSRILQNPDPILGVQFGHLMLGVGALELAIASVCLFSKSQTSQIILVAWLATSFLTYRLALLWIGWHRPCPCLGNLTDALHIPPQTADTAMKVILAYLLIGSYASLFWLWRQRKTMAITPRT